MAFGDLIKKQQRDTTQTGFSKLIDEQQGYSGGLGSLNKKADLTTAGGLFELSKQVGLEEKAQKIISKKGEEPKKIFSGGFIMDIFDTLNTAQYGVVGLLKGKSFLEGVKTRASFTDKDALGDKGIAGAIVGTALDIAADPLTYLGGFGILSKAGKAIKATKAIKAGKRIVGASKAGQFLGRKFIYRFGQDPIYKKIAERTERAIAIGTRNIIDLVKPMTKLDPADQVKIANFRKLGKLDNLPPKLLEKAKPVFEELDNLGQKAVKAGLLKKETYDENVGRYIARLYKKHEVPEGNIAKIKQFFGNKKPKRIDLSRFKKRTDIPEDVRQAMGEIMEAGYPTAKSMVQLQAAVENANLFKVVSNKWGSKIIKEGFEKLPETKKLGALSGKAVPKPIFDDIQEILRIRSPLEKGLGKIIGGFKFGKVILNPATHARNIMSNFILNNFEGLNPARIDIYADAAKNLATKGKWYKEAKKVGLGLDTFASREIKDMLLGPEAKRLTSKAKQALGKVADLYGKEEEFAKMAQYIFQRKKGLSPEKAWSIAERATFNYTQVTPFIRRLRESIFGFPFITFTYKATPQVVRTLLTKPTKISNIGKIKNAIENQAGLEELQKERKTEPQWVKDGFYVKLPIKDKFNRSAYLDLSYILPFGDLVSGQFFSRQIKRETGLPEAIPEALTEKTPFFNLLKEVGRNQDFFGNKIWKESDSTGKQTADLMRHLMKTYLPPTVADQIPGGYRKDGTRRPSVIGRIKDIETRGVEAGGKQTRTLMQELMRNVGLKISPVDLELQNSYAEWEIRNALETLLLESGQIKEFTRPYVPKQ